MRDRINRLTPIAEENTGLTGHPATEKVELWTTEITDKTDNLYEDSDVYIGKNCPAPPESSAEKQKKLDQIDEVIKEDIDRL